uniref:Uncharacterized protein n=1 Tax=Amphimedon queenslandica TaxID=400682 RepID=A0A1X7UEM2_AMPQE
MDSCFWLCNEYQETPLHYAARRGSKIIVFILLNNEANVNAIDKWKLTALEIAIKEGHTEVVELLMDKGAIYEFHYIRNQPTALHIAAETLYPNIVELLIKKGINVNIKDKLCVLTNK